MASPTIARNTPKDLIGQRFGRLTVIAFAGHRRDRSGTSLRIWRCRCDCGGELITRRANLTKGDTRSCGCLARETGTVIKRHGRSGTPEYHIWKNLIARCTNPKNRSFRRYGGANVVVCQRWRNSFADFLADMGPRPSPEHSVDRRDNMGPYAPWNCRWATDAEQRRNRRCNVWLELDGHRMILEDWAARLGCTTSTIRRRLRNGWTLRDSLTIAPARHTAPRVPLTFSGRTQSVSAWARELGITLGALTRRIDQGWPLALALTTPPHRPQAHS